MFNKLNEKIIALTSVHKVLLSTTTLFTARLPNIDHESCLMFACSYFWYYKSRQWNYGV